MDASLSFDLVQLMTIAIVAGIVAQVVADFFQIPSIVCLLVIGIGLGRDGLGWVEPQLLGPGLEALVSMAVALVLFEGGLSLELREVGKVSGSLRNLITIGVLISFVGGGAAAYGLAEFPWPIALLYSSLVVVTGPTVIGPLLKNVRVERQVSTLLESEGVLIDPVGAILAVVVLDIITGKGASLTEVGWGIGLRLGLGGAIGAIGGWSIAQFLRRSAFLSEDLKNLVVLAGMWGLYGLSQRLESESGLMAAVVSGIVLRAAGPEVRSLRRFKGQLTILAVSVLFVLLAADLSLPSLVTLGWGGVEAVIVLMVVVRPVNVWLCTIGSGLTWQQKIFAGWVAPKGIVSASIASLFAILLAQSGIVGGEAIKALVFLTIILTVSLQGLTAGLLAGWLRLRSTEATGVLIAGATPLGRTIARLFRDHGEPVAIVETDPKACALAEADHLTVYCRSALDITVLEAAGLESLGTFVALTENGEVNAVLAQRAAEEFRPPRVLAAVDTAVPSASDSATPPATEPRSEPTKTTSTVRSALSHDLSLRLWNTYLVDQAVRLGETHLRSIGLEFQKAHLAALMRSGELLPLVIQRDDRLLVVAAGDEWQPGDRLIYLLHDPKPLLLQRLSGSNRPALVLETLPTVEEVPMPNLSADQPKSDPTTAPGET